MGLGKKKSREPEPAPELPPQPTFTPTTKNSGTKEGGETRRNARSATSVDPGRRASIVGSEGATDPLNSRKKLKPQGSTLIA